MPRRERRAKGSLRPLLRRVAPSRRSLAVGFGIVALALGAYMVARETSVFAIRGIEVRGASPAVAAQVRQALAPLVGTSLVGLDGGSALRRVEELPTVVRASYDRAFPHTLRVTVVPERPAAVLRSGSAAWLVSARGRIVRPLAQRADPGLPRIWLSASTRLRAGQMLGPAQGGAAAIAVGHAGSFADQIVTAASTHGRLVFALRSGVQLRLGDGSHLQLKLAVAARALPLLAAGTTFLDISAPERPVSGTAAQSGKVRPKSSSRG